MRRQIEKLWRELREALRDADPKKVERIKERAARSKLTKEEERAFEAQIRWSRGERAEARRLLESGHLDAHGQLILGFLVLEAGDVDGAASAFEKAANGGVKDVRLACGQGAVAVARGDFNSALRHFESAHRDDPEDWSIRFQEATMLAELGRSDEAIAALASVIAAKPGFVPAWRVYGRIQIGRGKAKEVIDELAPVIAELPPTHQLNVLRAQCLDALGDLEEAARALLPVAQETNDPDLLLHCGRLCLSVGAYPAVEEILRRLPEKHPAAWLLKGSLSEMRVDENVDATNYAFGEALKLAPDDVNAKTAFAAFLMRETKYQDWAAAKVLFEQLAGAGALTPPARLSLGFLRALGS